MSQTSLRLRVVPRYPASVTATDGIKAVRSGVDLVVKSDYSNLVQVADVPNPDKTFMLAWDSDIDNYQSMSFTNIINNIQDAVIGPPLAAIDATNPGTDQVVYFTGEGEAATYTASEFVRGISNAPDAGSFADSFGAMSASVYDPDSVREEVAFRSLSLQTGNDLADLSDLGAAQDNVQTGATFADITTANGAYVPRRNGRIKTQFFDMSATQRGGGANYVRRSLADLSGIPALAYFRSQDRYMPDGSQDATNGGYWVIDEASPHIRMFGGSDDNSDNAPNFDAASVYLNARGGGSVRGTRGESYKVQTLGSVTGRGYCVLLKDGVAYEDIDFSYDRTATTVDVVISDDVGNLDALVTSNVTLRNVTVNGGSRVSAAGNGMNFWLRKIKNLRIENARSIDATNWGMRVEQCDGVFFDGFSCDHYADVNADGLHIMDCRNVSGNVGHLYTAGDDAFIIEAANYDVENINLSGLVVEAPTAGISAGRGVVILRDTSVGTTLRKLSNINVNAVAKNCYGSALSFSTGAAAVSNSHFSVVSDGCSTGLSLNAGLGAYPGKITNSVFDIVAKNTANQALFMSMTAGSVIDGNTVNARLSNPADGKVGAVVVGTRWEGAIALDYDPLGTKVSKTLGLDLSMTKSNLRLLCTNADRNLYFRAAAVNNSIHLGCIEGGVTSDVETVSGAVDNRFFGGSVAGTIILTGTTNKFFGTKGAATYGNVALNFATNADGTAVFSHGLNGTPSKANLQLLASGLNYNYSVSSRTSTQITVQLRNAATGSAITTGTFTFSYDLAL